MTDDIIVARRPTGQISFLGQVGGEKLIKKGWQFIRIDRNLLPRGTTHADLWDWLEAEHGDAIQVCRADRPTNLEPNLDMIRLRQTQKILQARANKLQELDVEWFKASECCFTWNRKRAIATRKQELRDMEYGLGHLDDPIDILNHWPNELFQQLKTPGKMWDVLVYTPLVLLLLTAASAAGGSFYLLFTAM